MRCARPDHEDARQRGFRTMMDEITRIAGHMQDNTLIWALFGLYLVGTSWLAWLGHKKTDGIESFAIGKGDMSPVVVGITLAASIASTATFVINPGFVYVHGVAALMHLGVAIALGLFAGLVIMSTGFRRIGAKNQALTLPQWVGERYGSKAMSVFFAAINLLSLTFVVLIVAGLSIVMQKTLGLTNVQSLVVIIGFVFSYIFIGGTYAHAYTNTLQGGIMVIIASIIIFSGVGLLFDGEAFARIAETSPELLAPINPKSPLFNSFFSVFVSGFIVGFALVCQPHIMTKALYVKNDKDVRRYLIVTITVFTLFTALLLVGLYAHLAQMDPQLFVDATTGKMRQDMVMTVYIIQTFPDWLVAVITVALMAAGMSTLDGILVALSSIAANDLFLNLTRNNVLKDKTPTEQSHIAHRASQVILIAMGVLAFIISLSPPKLLGIFGQVGVYGIVAASTVPILFGILVPTLKKEVAFSAALTGLITHFCLYGAGQWLMTKEQTADWGFFNPGVTATYGLIVSTLVVLPVAIAHFTNKGAASPEAGAEAAG